MTDPAARAVAFMRGPSVVPASELVAWLEAQKCDGRPRLVRLPLILRLTEMGISLAGATIGGHADALEVYANDGSLGLGLADRLRGHCSDDVTCAVWVEGYWRGDIEGEYQFDVLRVAGIIAPDELPSANYAEIAVDRAD